MTDELDLIKEVASRLKEAGINYMMTGSMAMAVYSTPRMTRDIDMVIQVSPDETGKIVNLFRDDFYIDEAAVREAILHHGTFNMIHNESIIKFDFIVRKNDEYRVLEFSRRQQIDIGGMPVSVVAPEDLILSKLVWAKESNSELERMNDTTPDIQKRMAAMIAQRSPTERLRMASSMFETGRTLVRTGLLKQNESLNEGQIRAQVFLRFYADDFTMAEIKEISSRIPNMILDDENQAASSL